MSWQPISTFPKDESIHFLVMTPGNESAPFLVKQVSVFEGNMYPDADGCMVNWIDRIQNASHWMPIPALPAPSEDRET